MDSSVALYVKNIPSILSVFGCLWVFGCYWNASVKTIGLKMVFILSISDFLFHSLVIGAYWTNSSSIKTVETFIVNAMVRFSLFWASNISFFLYKMVGLNQTAYLRRHLRWSLLVLMLVSCGLGVIILTESVENFWAVMWTMVLPLIVSICATTFFYYRSKQVTSKRMSLTLEISVKAIKSLYGFSFTQIATLCPVIIYDLAIILGMNDSQIWEAIADCCLGLTGLANALLFFMHKHKSTFSESKYGVNDITKVSTLSSQSMRDALIVEYHQ